LPRIQSVAVCVARVPLDNVTSFATRTVSARDYCLVKVRSASGVEGIGFCYAGYGATVCPHWFHDAHAPLVAATPNARYVEFFPDDQVLDFWRLIDRQLQHRDGNLILHQASGLGLGFDEKAVRKYALVRSRPWTVIK
jgi:L-alanine-DL-glutamate epimerase-like enolase superfamily enzyme